MASDGGVFAFDAPFRGSLGHLTLNRPVNGLVAYGNGYLMVASDGGVFTFSDKLFVGSLGAPPARGSDRRSRHQRLRVAPVTRAHTAWIVWARSRTVVGVGAT